MRMSIKMQNTLFNNIIFFFGSVLFLNCSNVSSPISDGCPQQKLPTSNPDSSKISIISLNPIPPDVIDSTDTIKATIAFNIHNTDWNDSTIYRILLVIPTNNGSWESSGPGHEIYIKNQLDTVQFLYPLSSVFSNSYAWHPFSCFFALVRT